MNTAVEGAIQKVKENKFSPIGVFCVMQVACMKQYPKKIEAKKYIMEAMLLLRWEYPKEYGSIRTAYVKFIRQYKLEYGDS